MQIHKAASLSTEGCSQKPAAERKPDNAQIYGNETHFKQPMAQRNHKEN